MTAEEQAKRRKTRATNETRLGRDQLPVENVDIKDFSGRALKPVAEFRYLGTIATANGNSAKEIDRRLALATAVFARLGKIWMTGDISLKLKCDLYFAIVMTVLLYNGECWVVSPRDLKRLEGFHFRCARRITRRTRCPDMADDHKEDRASHAEVFRVSRLPRIDDMLREKRLRWFGHLARGEEGDPAKNALEQEMAQGDSKWWAQMVADFKLTKIGVKNSLKMAANRSKWRNLSACRAAQRRQNGRPGREYKASLKKK